MKKLLIFLYPILFVFLTNGMYAQEKKISGKLTGFQNGEKIKLYDPEIMKTLDSTYIKNGNFKLKNPLGEMPELVFIIANDDLVCSAFIAGENIEISGDKKDFKFGLNFKSSEFQKEKDILDNETRNYWIERDTLERYMEDSDTSKAYLALQKIKLKRIKEIDKATTKIAVKYIRQHSNSYYGLLYLSYYVDEFSKKELQNFYNKAGEKLQQSIYGKKIKTFLEVGKIIEEGDAFFDFEAKGQDGKTHKLSEIKNSYILLDFNETYCGPCVESVNELKKIAVNYKEHLQIVSFCADKPEDIWKKGLNRDKPNWLSLWDGKGTQGSTVIKYGSKGFPTFVLIDKKGKIVNITVGFEKKILEKMLNENIKL
jgi:thiol-disulfide isomerase/thioredoxin